MNRLIPCFWVWALFLPFAGSAQDCRLTVAGRVLDAHDGTPLPFTTVYVAETGKGTLADTSGRFVLESLCAGTYTLVASHVGCDPERTVMHVDRDTVLVIFLEHHIELLDPVTATAYRVEETASQTRGELAGTALKRLAGRSLAQMLTRINGVRMVQTGPGIQKPVIQGLYGSRILIIQNDVRQEGQQWGVDHAPEIDPTVAGRLVVIKGAEGVRYGPDALGGVILIAPDPLPRTPGTGGSVQSEFQTNGWGGKLAATLQGGIGHTGWGWRSTGSARILGDQRAPAYILSNTGLREWGWSGQAGYTGNRHTLDVYYSFYAGEFGILRAAHIGNLTDLETAIRAPEPWYQRPFGYEVINPRQKVWHHLAKAEASRRVDDLWTLKSRLSFQADDRQEYDIRRGDRDDRPALDLRILTTQWELIAEHRPWRHWKGSAGISVQHQTNFNQPGTGTRPLIPNFITATASVFALERYLADDWEWEAGGRYDFRYLEVSRIDENGRLVAPAYRFSNINFSTGGLWRFAPRWSLLVNVGTAFRPPGVNELFSQGLHHASAAIEEGNDRLKVEKAIKAVTTIRFAGQRASLELSGFVQRIGGFIYLRPEAEYALTIRGAFPVFRYVQTDALLTGADLQMQWAPGGGWSWMGQASLVRADDLRSDHYLFGIPPVQFFQELTWEKPGVKSGHLWQVALSARHVLRQDRSPSSDFQPAPSGFTLLSASAALEMPRSRITIGADNLLNNTYREYLDRLRYFADGPGISAYAKWTIDF